MARFALDLQFCIIEMFSFCPLPMCLSFSVSTDGSESVEVVFCLGPCSVSVCLERGRLSVGEERGGFCPTASQVSAKRENPKFLGPIWCMSYVYSFL